MRAACRATWRKDSHVIGGATIVVQSKTNEGSEDFAHRFIKGQLANNLVKSGCMISMSLSESGAQFIAYSNTKIVHRVLPDHYANWVLLIEGYDPGKLLLPLHREVVQNDSQRNGLLVGSLTRYELMYAFSAAGTLPPARRT